MFHRIPSETRFSSFCYRSSTNIGDDIQYEACEQLVPISYRVNRENIWGSDRRPPSILVINGWMIHSPFRVPPPNLVPLYTSICIGGSDKFWHHPDVASHLQTVGPVGCRDLKTLKEMQAKDIPSFYSGCLTLTLESNLERNNDIYFVDVPDNYISRFPEPYRSRGIKLTHTVYDRTGNRRQIARNLLKTYATAGLVITSRLHCALPCLAFSTPVIMVLKGYDYRQYPYEQFGHIYREHDLDQINWQPPIPNVAEQKQRIRDSMRESVGLALERFKVQWG